MRTETVALRVDAALLTEVRKLEGDDFDPSAILNDALRALVPRLRLLALLDEMDRNDPITPDGRAAGEELWRRMTADS